MKKMKMKILMKRRAIENSALNDIVKDLSKRKNGERNFSRRRKTAKKLRNGEEVRIGPVCDEWVLHSPDWFHIFEDKGGDFWRPAKLKVKKEYFGRTAVNNTSPDLELPCFEGFSTFLQTPEYASLNPLRQSFLDSEDNVNYGSIKFLGNGYLKLSIPWTLIATQRP
jgi:hypothetical protein